MEGNFKSLSWSDRVSKGVGHVNEGMSQKVDEQAVLELYRSRDDRRKINGRG